MSDSGNNARGSFQLLFDQILDKMVDQTTDFFVSERSVKMESWDHYIALLNGDDASFIVSDVSEWPSADFVRLVQIYQSAEVMLVLRSVWTNPCTCLCNVTLEYNIRTVNILLHSLLMGLQLRLINNGVSSNKVNTYLQWRRSDSFDEVNRQLVWTESVIGDKVFPKFPESNQVAV